MTDPHGPKNLDQAFGYIEKEMSKRNGQRNGHVRSTASPEFNKICSICGTLFYHKAILVDPDLKPMPCEKCQRHLDDGMIAVHTISGRHCFIFSPTLAGENQIQEVSEEVFDAVEKRAKEQAEEKQPPAAE